MTQNRTEKQLKNSITTERGSMKRELTKGPRPKRPNITVEGETIGDLTRGDPDNPPLSRPREMRRGEQGKAGTDFTTKSRTHHAGTLPGRIFFRPTLQGHVFLYHMVDHHRSGISSLFRLIAGVDSGGKETYVLSRIWNRSLRAEAHYRI